MDMDYKPNSHKYKEEMKEKKVEKVVKGKVRRKKKSSMTKFADVFVAEDASNVVDYIWMDVLIPTIKNTISDIITNGVDMMLWGAVKGNKRRSSNTYVSYRDYSSRDRRDDRTVTRRSGYSFDDIVIPSRREADEVLEKMDEIIDRYDIVSVSDYYDLVGETGNYTDNKYGWSSLRTAEVVRVRDGYIIKLPKPKVID